MISPKGVIQKNNWGNKLQILHLFFPRRKKDIDWVSGGSLFVTKENFQRVGGFDQNFFLYFEDMDLCVRLKKQGLKIFLEEKKSLIHFGGKSFKDKKQQKKNYDQSLYHYAKKHWSPESYFTLRILHPMYRFLFPYGRK